MLEAHPDYVGNMGLCEDLINNNKNRYPKGVNIMYGSAHGLGGSASKSVIYISFTPKEGYGTTECAAINLHQNHWICKDEIRNYWNAIIALSKTREGRHDHATR
jgi:hypothetical protein